MPHDHGSEKKENSHQSHVDDEDTPKKAQNTGLGLAAQMRLISEGKEAPSHFHIPSQGGHRSLMNSAMLIGSHTDGAHIHGPGCGCGASHNENEHHHHDDKPENYNYGVLKTLFSKAGIDSDGWLERHRSKAVLGAAAALTWAEYQTTGSASMGSSLAMIFGTAMVAHDASEDLMEAAGQLNESHNISTGVVGMSVGAAHTASEGLLSVTSQMSGNENIAIATTMGSNVSHIPLMAGMAGVIGALSIDKSYAWKMNAAFMGGVTGAFGYQIATGDFNPWMSAGTAAAGATYLLWRVRAGQTCAVHGDGCGHVHHGQKDETDYISVSYARDIAHKIKNIEPDKTFSNLARRVKSTKQKISNVSIPTLEQATTKLKNIGQAISHENVVKLGTSLTALGLSAHVLGDNVIRLAEHGGMSTTAVGATVAALAFALPELILTGKAAAKKDGEMAWGAVTGCTVATVGIVGGYQGLSGFDVPASLSLATTEGKVQMAAFAGSAGAIIAAVHPWSAKQLARADNAIATLFENRMQSVANWLRNDGTKLSKVVAAPMVGLALTYYAASTLPVCHSHGEFMHCFDKNATTDSEGESLMKLPGLEGATQPLLSAEP